MGTQIIPYTAPAIPEPEILAPEPQPAEEYHSALQEAARAMRLSTMRIAYYGFRMRLSEGWTMFGMPPGPKGEEQYREFIGVPRSTWYRMCRIGQALHQLTLPELERIPIANAEILLSVSPTIWHDFSWVHEAKSLPSTRLAELVTERNKAAGDDREPMEVMVFRLPSLAKQAIRTMLDVFQNKHELSSQGQALELLIADRYDRGNLLGAVSQAQKLIGAVLFILRDHKKRFNEQVEFLELASEVLHAASQEAIQASRKKSKGI